MVSDGVKKVAVHLIDRRIKGVAKAGCARRHRAPLTSTNICRHTAAIVAAPGVYNVNEAQICPVRQNTNSTKAAIIAAMAIRQIIAALRL